MQSFPQNVELLWLIPVVAVGFFVFILQLVLTKKREEKENTSHSLKSDKKESIVIEERIKQLENSIANINKAISDQEKLIEKFEKENMGYYKEINELRSKLKEMYKEYELIVSENYSLKAKIKKLQEQAQAQNREESISYDIEEIDKKEEYPVCKIDPRLYEDTRTLNLSLINDTSEIDLADILEITNSTSGK
ncbi:MAG: hypothetical protein N2053_10650 [Chitinispirillaceae bacterium]|nr:hypothetical protein [Chitinispirillaceae bacterium]